MSAPTNHAVMVPFSPAPVFDGAAGQSFELTLTAAANALTRNMTPGLLYSFDVGQDATGGRIFQWPGVMVNAAPVNLAPNARTTQTFIARGDGKLYAIAAGTVNGV